MIVTHENAYRELLAVLNRLDDAKPAYRLRHSRPDVVSVDVAVPGERWEIEFVDYDDTVHVEVEIFRSTGDVARAENQIDQLIQTFGSDATAE